MMLNTIHNDKLLYFQKEGVARLLELKNALLADDQGLGKTIQFIVYCDEIQADKILVICPSHLIYNWKNEFEKWQTTPRQVSLFKSTKDILETHTNQVIIVSYDLCIKEAVRNQLHQHRFLVVACDEAHKLKNPKSKRNNSIFGKGTLRGIIQNIPRKVFITGTAFQNSPKELWPLLHNLNPSVWPNEYAFYFRYCAPKKLHFGNKIVHDFSGSSNTAELRAKLFKTTMVRRLKSEVLLQLPAKRREISLLDSHGLTKFIKAELNTVDVNSIEQLNDSFKLSFSEFALARHELAIAKIPSVLNYILETLENKEKLIIFAYHKIVISELAKALKDYGVVTVVGGMSAAQKQEAVKQFQEDPNTLIFLGNIEAAGEGLTLTASSRIIFAEITFVPSQLVQAEDRAHRIGQFNPVLVTYLVLDGSLDARMMKIMFEKQKVFNEVMN